MVRKGRCSQLELRRPVLHRLGLGLSCTRTRQHVSPVVPTPRRCAPHVAIAGHVISSKLGPARGNNAFTGNDQPRWALSSPPGRI